MALDAPNERDRQRRIRESDREERTPQPQGYDPRIGVPPWTPIVLRSVNYTTGTMWFQRLRYADRPPVVGQYEAYGERELGYPLPTARYEDYAAWVWPEDPITTETKALLARRQDNYWIVLMPFTTEASAAMGHGAYVFGGYNETCKPEVKGDNTFYTPDRWSVRAPLLCYPRYGHAGVAVADAAYSFAGNSPPNNFLFKTDRYVPDGWASKKDMLNELGRQRPAAFAISGAAYVTGGSTSALGKINKTERYAPDPIDAWSVRRQYPIAMWEAGAFSIGDVGYVVGGIAGRHLVEMYAYGPVPDATWTPRAFLTADAGGARAEHCALSIGELGYVAGGKSALTGGFIAEFPAYNPVTDSWSEAAAMPSPVPGLGRYHHMAATIGTKGYLFGGMSWEERVMDDTNEYTPEAGYWSTGKAPLPTPKRHMGAAASL